MFRILIIGYGNPLRGDDGLGWRIAERLQEEMQHPEVKILIRHQLTPELAEDISQVDSVIFIDAGSKGKPGTICVTEVQIDESLTQLMTHSQTPEGLLMSAEILFGRRPRAYLLSVAAASFEYVETLSPEAEAAVPQAVERVRELVEKNLS